MDLKGKNIRMKYKELEIDSRDWNEDTEDWEWTKKTQRIMEKLSFNLTELPEFDIKDLCLCGGPPCKEIDLDIKLSSRMNTVELLQLLGLVGFNNVRTCALDELPIKLTFEIDAIELQKQLVKLRKIKEKEKKRTIKE